MAGLLSETHYFKDRKDFTDYLRLLAVASAAAFKKRTVK